MKEFSEEIANLFTKILIPAFIAVSVSIAVRIKKFGKISFLNVILAYIIGISTAYLSGFFIYEHLSNGAAIISISVIAISGEKIGYWLVFKLRIDDILSSVLDALKKWLIKWFE